MQTLLAFVLALGILITVHEYGHYRVARACGVKVLRFSIGFGGVLWRRQRSAEDTEFVISWLPLGGYVRMLDESEGVVAASEQHRAFNRKPLAQRAAVVAAGPLANLLLAVVLYSAVNWLGMPAPQAILAAPPAGSLAASAGLVAQDRVLRMAWGDEQQAVESLDDLRWGLTQAVLSRQDLALEVERAGLASTRTVVLPLAGLPSREVDQQLFERVGLGQPWLAPVIGELVPQGAAERDGLRPGDRVLKVDEVAVQDAAHLRALIRQAVNAQGQPREQRWTVQRGPNSVQMAVTPSAEQGEQGWVGRIGARVGGQPQMTTVVHSGLDGLWRGLQRTWEVSAATVSMLGQMLSAEASVSNLSGPLTIADYAGQSAALGWVHYLQFLALISVSLGILNLLPLPVLDGGHLMYYLWEAATGKPVSPAWMEWLSRGGVAILAALMLVALFNDVARLLG